MNVFHPAIAQQEPRFRCPRFKPFHYITIFADDGTVDYLTGEGDMSPLRSDAREYDDIVDAETDCSILTAQDFDASVETFQRSIQ